MVASTQEKFEDLDIINWKYLVQKELSILGDSFWLQETPFFPMHHCVLSDKTLHLSVILHNLCISIGSITGNLKNKDFWYSQMAEYEDMFSLFYKTDSVKIYT